MLPRNLTSSLAADVQTAFDAARIRTVHPTERSIPAILGITIEDDGMHWAVYPFSDGRPGDIPLDGASGIERNIQGVDAIKSSYSVILMNACSKAAKTRHIVAGIGVNTLGQLLTRTEYVTQHGAPKYISIGPNIGESEFIAPGSTAPLNNGNVDELAGDSLKRIFGSITPKNIPVTVENNGKTQTHAAANTVSSRVGRSL